MSFDHRNAPLSSPVGIVWAILHSMAREYKEAYWVDRETVYLSAKHEGTQGGRTSAYWTDFHAGWANRRLSILIEAPDLCRVWNKPKVAGE